MPVLIRLRYNIFVELNNSRCVDGLLIYINFIWRRWLDGWWKWQSQPLSGFSLVLVSSKVRDDTSWSGKNFADI